MENIKLNIFIGILTFILCLIITITSGIHFLWIIVPVIFIILIAFLSSVLQERFGRTYGITGYLILLFVIPILWYLFSANMPITSKMIESQKKAEDLSSFQKYQGSVDAKKEVAQYQMKQDSILREQVSALLNIGKVDSALVLIKQNETSSERIKNELFSSITSPSSKSNEKQINSESEGQDHSKSFGGRIAVINDPDGYTNVRSSQGINFPILGVIKLGEKFYAKANKANDWWQVKTQSGLIGYVHKSRIQFIQ